jgi:hypothetical protein
LPQCLASTRSWPPIVGVCSRTYLPWPLATPVWQPSARTLGARHATDSSSEPVDATAAVDYELSAVAPLAPASASDSSGRRTNRLPPHCGQVRSARATRGKSGRNMPRHFSRRPRGAATYCNTPLHPCRLKLPSQQPGRSRQPLPPRKWEALLRPIRSCPGKLRGDLKRDLTPPRPLA